MIWQFLESVHARLWFANILNCSQLWLWYLKYWNRGMFACSRWDYFRKRSESIDWNVFYAWPVFYNVPILRIIQSSMLSPLSFANVQDWVLLFGLFYANFRTRLYIHPLVCTFIMIKQVEQTKILVERVQATHTSNICLIKWYSYLQMSENFVLLYSKQLESSRELRFSYYSQLSKFM